MKPIRHPVTVPGGFFRLGDEPTPAVVAPGNALLVLLKVEGPLHPVKGHLQNVPQANLSADRLLQHMQQFLRGIQ